MKANHSEQAFHFHKQDPSSRTSIICIFNCNFLPFCSIQSDRKVSEVTTHSEHQQRVKPQSNIWVLFEILAAFSEKKSKKTNPECDANYLFQPPGVSAKPLSTKPALPQLQSHNTDDVHLDTSKLLATSK